jgi:hypothetical protein
MISLRRKIFLSNPRNFLHSILLAPHTETRLFCLAKLDDVIFVLFTTWAAVLYRIYANVVNGLKNDSSYEFIGEVILKINVV